MISRNQTGGGKSRAAIANRQRHKRVHAMAQGRCYYCGTPTIHQGQVGPRDWMLLGQKYRMVREHVVPTSRGGVHGKSNFVPACSGCNYEKGPFTIDEFRLVKAFQTRNMQFRFWGDQGPVMHRDWIICHSPSFERALVERQMPSACDGYVLRRRANGPMPLTEPRIRPVNL